VPPPGTLRPRARRCTSPGARVRAGCSTHCGAILGQDRGPTMSEFLTGESPAPLLHPSPRLRLSSAHCLVMKRQMIRMSSMLRLDASGRVVGVLLRRSVGLAGADRRGRFCAAVCELGKGRCMCTVRSGMSDEELGNRNDSVWTNVSRRSLIVGWGARVDARVIWAIGSRSERVGFNARQRNPDPSDRDPTDLIAYRLGMGPI
jgi:hypothetical protein